jgi:hypothetical protein
MKDSIKLLVVLALISSTSYAHECGHDIQTKNDDKNVLIIKAGKLHQQLLILKNLGMMSDDNEGVLELNGNATDFLKELEGKGLIEDVLLSKSTICI